MLTGQICLRPNPIQIHKTALIWVFFLEYLLVGYGSKLRLLHLVPRPFFPQNISLNVFVVWKFRFSLILSSARKWFRFFNTSVLIDLYRYLWALLLLSVCFLPTVTFLNRTGSVFFQADLFCSDWLTGSECWWKGPMPACWTSISVRTKARRDMACTSYLFLEVDSQWPK